jgi:uncharacterized protein
MCDPKDLVPEESFGGTDEFPGCGSLTMQNTAGDPMTAIPAQTPTIRNAGTSPSTPHKLFINIPVNDLQRSIDFFEALGFNFNPQFTDATATCMIVGEGAYFMLLTNEKFREFSKRTIPDTLSETGALFAISADSRESVDAMVKQAIAAGGASALDPQDHGFMYGWSFYDVDGYHWEVFWMDPDAANG